MKTLDERAQRPSADATRERILAAALDLFAERSYEGASTRLIAERAGVRQPLLTYHFGSKTELWRAAVGRLFEDLARALSERVAGLRGVDEETVARLVVADFVRFSASHPELHRIIMQECKTEGDRLAWLVEEHIQPLYALAVAMFDLDRFKGVNDRYGHAVGDAVLRKFCEVTAVALRPYDLFGRVGGEEFVVVMPGCSIEAAFVRAERIRVSFAESCRFFAGHQVKATVSGGVSVSETSAETLDALLGYSDSALYEAKAEGRNRIHRASVRAAGETVSNVFRVA